MAVQNLAFKAEKSCQQQLSLKQLAHNVHIGKRARPHRTDAGKSEESLMAGELVGAENLKLALDAADAATDVTSGNMSGQTRTQEIGKKSVTDSPLHHQVLLSPELSRRLPR